jgi:hypothetical protein
VAGGGEQGQGAGAEHFDVVRVGMDGEDSFQVFYITSQRGRSQY